MTLEETQGGNGFGDENSMAALLDQESVAYRDLRRGEIVEGTVVGTDRDGILVDVGAKSEGVIPPNEMHCLQPEGPSKLSMGDKVLVSVVQPESHEGQVILSLDRARGERGWRVLQDYLDNNEAFQGYVTGSNKGGLLVNVEGVNAFVPLSQIVAGPERGNPDATQRALTEWVGKNITLKVIELNRRRNRAILSERSAVQEKRAAEKERLLLELHEGDVKTGRITSIRDFGVFVDIGGADGLVHLSELSWERTPKSPHEIFHVGDEVPVYVLKVDSEAKKIALSVRRAQPERWEEIVSRYREGEMVPGQVTKLAPFGAFVRLEGPIEGLIHISELVDRRITHPREVVEEGDVVPVKIVRIEYDRHRLGLSLKQARDRAEEQGWVFNASGGTLKAPMDQLDKLGLAAMPQRPQPAEPDQDGARIEDGAAPLSDTEVMATPAAADGTVAASPEADAPVAMTDAETADEAVALAEEPAAQAEAPVAMTDAGTATEAVELAEEPSADVSPADAPAMVESVAEPVADAPVEIEQPPVAPTEEEAQSSAESETATQHTATLEEHDELPPTVEEISADLADVSAEEAAPAEAELAAVADEAPAQVEAEEPEVAEPEVAEGAAVPEETPEMEAEVTAQETAAAEEPADILTEATSVVEQAQDPVEVGVETVSEQAKSDVTEETADAFNKSDEE